MKNKKTIKIISGIVFLILFSLGKNFAQNNIKDIPSSISKDGFISSWLVAGPFEQPTFGFGNPADADKIGEKTVVPYQGK